MNIYEINVDENLIKDVAILDTYLFQCQCALFLIDITSKESFELVKDLFESFEIKSFPYLKIIIVLTKTDLSDKKKINLDELNEFLNSNSSFQKEEISINSKNNISKLLNKINSAVNVTNNNFPCNFIFESIESKSSLINYDGSLSFILLGDSTVGKTCFYRRYFKDDFNPTVLPTIGIDKQTKHVKIKNKSFKISLWDTAGQERFKKLLPKNYYNNADGIFLLFDLTKEISFESVTIWVENIKENANKSKVVDGKEIGITLYLIGNKIDLPNREVNKKHIISLAQSIGAKYFEISCKTNMNIPEVMLNMIMDSYINYYHSGERFSLESSKKHQKRKCC